MLSATHKWGDMCKANSFTSFFFTLCHTHLTPLPLSFVTADLYSACGFSFSFVYPYLKLPPSPQIHLSTHPNSLSSSSCSPSLAPLHPFFNHVVLYSDFICPFMPPPTSLIPLVSISFIPFSPAIPF